MTDTTHAASALKSAPGLASRWWAPLLLVVAGVLCTVVATMLYNGWDSGLPQESLTDMAAKAAADGRGARYLLVTDLFGFLPGMVLVVSGLLLTMRRAPDLPRWFQRSSSLVLAALALAAVGYVIQVGLNFLLLGTIDLSGGEFTLSESVHSAWSTAASIDGALIVVSVFGTLVHLVVSLVLLVIRLIRRKS